MDTSALRAIFPKTLDILKDHQRAFLSEQFGRTVCEELAIPAHQDSSLWFPVFLKVQGVNQEILEVAEFEYLRHCVMLDEEDIPSKQRSEQNDPNEQNEKQPIGVNPSVQFIELHFDQPRLGRRSGLYCFLKTEGRFFEFQLGLEQALAIDLLHEERLFSIPQLAEMAHSHSLGQRLDVDGWKNLLSKMLAMGLLHYKATSSARPVFAGN